MVSINFTKMQGLGNDFVLIDARKEKLEGIALAELAVEICDRHFGVGADGLLIVWPSDKANIRMQIFNPDGSEPQMCGNGIRCFAKYIYETSAEKKDVISVETRAGVLIPAVIKDKDKIAAIEVDMGEPRLKASQIPLLIAEQEKVIELAINLESKTYRATCVSMGNPHCVIFVKDFSEIDLYKDGPQIETLKIFPENTNVEFAHIVNRQAIEVKVWERGAGETLACGTGACAVVVAASLNGLADRKTTIHLPGGELEIEWQADDNHVIMRGPAEQVFAGSYSI
jgi:diaminopimelate epimerase